MKAAAQLLRKQPAWVVLLLSAALLALVGWIDVITGPELTFTQFYLVPVCLVAWLLGARWGYVMTLVSAGVCLLAEHLGAAVYTQPGIQEWNFVVRLAFFIAAVFLISTWKSIGARLSDM